MINLRPEIVQALENNQELVFYWVENVFIIVKLKMLKSFRVLRF